MRWVGRAQRGMEIAREYVEQREGFGIKHAERESVQMKLGEVGKEICKGRRRVMDAAGLLDAGSRARSGYRWGGCGSRWCARRP
jgi:acyl-CoA dehydrogenase